MLFIHTSPSHLPFTVLHTVGGFLFALSLCDAAPCDDDRTPKTKQGRKESKYNEGDEDWICRVTLRIKRAALQNDRTIFDCLIRLLAKRRSSNRTRSTIWEDSLLVGKLLHVSTCSTPVGKRRCAHTPQRSSYALWAAEIRCPLSHLLSKNVNLYLTNTNRKITIELHHKLNRKQARFQRVRLSVA